MAGAPYERLKAAFKDDGGVNYSLYGTRYIQYIIHTMHNSRGGQTKRVIYDCYRSALEYNIKGRAGNVFHSSYSAFDEPHILQNFTKF